MSVYRTSMAFASVSLAFLLSISSAFSASQNTLTSQKIDSGEFKPDIWYYSETKDRKLEFNPSFRQSRFKRGSSDFNAGILQPPHWFKVPLTVPNDFDATLHPIIYLEIEDPLLDKIELYHEINGEISKLQVTGSTLPFNQRPYESSTFVFPFNVQPGDSHIFWMRVEATNSMQLPVIIKSPEAYSRSEGIRTICYGLLFGILAIMAVYNLAIGLMVKDATYLYFSLMLMAGGIHRCLVTGFGFQYLWPNLPELNPILRPIADNFLCIVSIRFAQTYLQTKINAPMAHTYLNILTGVAAVSALTVFFLPYNNALSIALWVLLINFLSLYGVGIEVWLKRIKMARLFVIGWFAYLAGGIISVLAALGVLPANFYTEHMVEFGVLIQVVTLSMALSSRIGVMQEETIIAQNKTVMHMSRYQDLYEKSLDGIFEINAIGRLLHCNPAFCSIVGLAPDAVESGSINIKELFLSEEEFNQLANLLTINKQVKSHEYEFRKYNEGYIWASISLRTSEKEGRIAYEGTLRDISEHKEKEKALLAQKNAEAATSAKSAFLANMSHEIRTPLTAIIGFAEDARDEEMSEEELEESVDIIVRSGHHLLDVINEILDISKIEAGKLELEILNTDLFALVADVQSVFEQRIQAKGLKFCLDYHFPLPPNVKIDPTRVKQIILNLLGNALKFTEEGSITLQLNYNDTSSCLEFAVTDSGVGMTPPQQEKIFDAFTQADVSTSRSYGGTGLGLNIVKQLLHLMGGEVSVESEIDKGSIFRINVPITLENEGNLVTSIDQISDNQKQKKYSRPPKLTGNILYAEDNPVNQQLVHNLVKRSGANIEIANNGVEAILLFLKHSPDLILMDIQMPIIGGVTVTKLLRTFGYNTPIIACTANVMASEAETYLATGFNACVEKPINKPAFYEALSRYCSKAPPDICTAEVNTDTEQAAEKKIATKKTEKKSDSSNKLKGKILVAEDNTVNQTIIKRCLKNLGADVTVVENGILAVEQATQQQYDLILMDLQMPRLNGLEAGIEIQSCGCATPIYALTADPDKETRDACEAAGFKGVLLKPIDREAIKQTVETHLSVQP